MEKQILLISKKEYLQLANGDVDLVETTLNGIPAYIEAVDYETGLKVGDRDVSVNYFAPNLDCLDVAYRAKARR